MEAFLNAFGITLMGDSNVTFFVRLLYVFLKN